MSERTIGRYQIRGKLGEGAMAYVLRAYDPLFKRDVALKVLRSQFANDAVVRERFIREARAIATLEHPAIVPIYDAGQDGRYSYFVMQLMSDGTLADRLRHGALPLPDVVKIVERVGSALDEAHSHGIIHRDVKPANILFDRFGRAYLADFGIVKQAETGQDLTQDSLIGTPAYMSPEQVRGKPLDGRSDLYSLGIVLFEMLTGIVPYESDTSMGTAMRHLVDPIPDIRSANAKLPRAFQTVIGRILAKEPNDRYKTGAELAEALTVLLALGNRRDVLVISRSHVLWGMASLLIIVAALSGGAALRQRVMAGRDMTTAQQSPAIVEPSPAPTLTPSPSPEGQEATQAGADSANQQLFPSPTSPNTPTLPPTIEVPTESPTIAAQAVVAGPRLRITVDRVNVRTGPGISFPAFAGLDRGEEVATIGRTSDSSWFNIVLEDKRSGWVAASVSELIPPTTTADIEIARTVPAPPATSTPTQTQTPVPPTNTPIPPVPNTPTRVQATQIPTNTPAPPPSSTETPTPYPIGVKTATPTPIPSTHTPTPASYP